MTDHVFKPRDKFTHRSQGTDEEHEVLSDGHTDDIGTWHLARFHNGRIGAFLTTHVRPVPLVVFTEAHIEAMRDVLEQQSNIANWPIEKVTNILRRDYGEKTEA